jgi:hypothetical protein
MTKQRDHVRSCRAYRDALLRAHDHNATPTDLKVLNAACWWLVTWSKLADEVRLDRVAAVVYAIEPSHVRRHHRNRVRESLHRWQERGILNVRFQRGRPSKDQGGPWVEIELVEHEERHPVSRVLYSPKEHSEKHSASGVTFAQEKHSGASRKALSSDEKSTQLQREKHSSAPPEMQHAVEIPGEVSVEQSARESNSESDQNVKGENRHLGEQQQERRDWHVPDDWLAARLYHVCEHSGWGVKLEAEDVVRWARAVVDDRLIDQAIGFADQKLPERPRKPRAVVQLIETQAERAGIQMPPFDVERRRGQSRGH